MQTFLSVVFKYEEKINAFIDDLYKQKGKLIMRKKEISMIILMHIWTCAKFFS